MELKDAMAEVVLRAVLAHPERCPTNLISSAQAKASIFAERWYGDGEPWPENKKDWLMILSDYTDLLPAILEGYDEK